MEWKEIVSGVAPLLAGVLSGGNPMVVGLTSSIIKKALGLPADANDSAITQTLQTDPDAVVKVKQAEMELKETLSRSGVDIEAIMAADRADARKTQVITRDKTPKILTVFASINFTVVLVIIGILASNGKLAAMTAMEASFVTLAARETFSLLQTIFDFYFGSSAGSQAKDDTIKTLTQ